jgi:hypothetical protein
MNKISMILLFCLILAGCNSDTIEIGVMGYTTIKQMNSILRMSTHEFLQQLSPFEVPTHAPQLMKRYIFSIE